MRELLVDHTLLDIHMPDGRRPWLTTVIDDHSKMVVGWHIHFGKPGTSAVEAALQSAIKPGENGPKPC